MTKETIIATIVNKISEHETELRLTTEELQNLKKEKTVESLQKFMILKDKSLFHKSVVMALKELLKEIENG